MIDFVLEMSLIMESGVLEGGGTESSRQLKQGSNLINKKKSIYIERNWGQCYETYARKLDHRTKKNMKCSTFFVEKNENDMWHMACLGKYNGRYGKMYYCKDERRTIK